MVKDLNTTDFFKVNHVEDILPPIGKDIIFYSKEYGWSEGFMGMDNKFFLNDSLNGVKGIKWLSPIDLPSKNDMDNLYDSHIGKYPHTTDTYENGILDGIELASNEYLKKI